MQASRKLAGPILDRLRHVGRSDRLRPGQVGDGAGQFQDPVVRPGRHVQLGHGGLEQALAGVVKEAVARTSAGPISALVVSERAFWGLPTPGSAHAKAVTSRSRCGLVLERSPVASFPFHL